MRNAAVICLALSALLFVVGGRQLVSAGKDGTITGGYIVGSLLVPVVLLIVGVWCLGKAKKAEKERAAAIIKAGIAEGPDQSPFGER